MYKDKKSGKETEAGPMKASSMDVVDGSERIGVCRPNFEYYEKRIEAQEEAIDMIEYLMNEGYIGYEEGNKFLGQTLVRVRDGKRSLKQEKKMYKQQQKQEKLRKKFEIKEKKKKTK